MKIPYILSIIPACALLSVACTNDEVTADDTAAATDVQFVISAPFSATPTRAANDGQYAPEVAKEELIKSYAVAVTPRGSRQIVAFATKDALGGVESDPVSLQLRPGDYTVYGFANIDAETILKPLGIKDSGTVPEGMTSAAADDAKLRTLLPGYATKLTTTSKLLLTLDDIKAKGIPMTSIDGQNITVTERVNQKFGIEVVRMLAKLQFNFSNPTANPLTIDGISISDMTLNEETDTHKLPLLWMNYETDRDNATNFNVLKLPADVKKGTLSSTSAAAFVNFDTATSTYTASDKNLAAGSPTLPARRTAVYYVMESAADDVSNTFELGFDIRKGGLEVDNLRYGLTNADHLTRIHRNDWIVIPITIGEWVMDLTALSFPPIGGYPDARVTSDQENVFEIAFSAPGDIAFYPTIHKYFDAAEYYYLNDPVRIKEVGGKKVDISCDDPKGVLAGPPVMGTAGELTARLTGATGTATVTLKTVFYTAPSLAPEVAKTFTSIIRITKE